MTAQVSRLPAKNTITDIANLAEQAQGAKPRVQDLADGIAGYFIPVVCTVALIIFVVWVVVVLQVRGQPADKPWNGYRLLHCRVGHQLPVYAGTGSTNGPSRCWRCSGPGGIIIKTAHVIERGFKVTDVLFDKTGTLTEPALEVAQEMVFPQ